MSTSQILDRAFQLYRSNFLLFAGIAALPPALILIMQVAALGGNALLTRVFGSAGSTVALVLGVSLLVIFYLAGYAFATGATVFAVSRVHMGSPVSISAAYAAVRPLLLRILGIMFVVGLMAVGAFLAGYLGGTLPTLFLRILVGRAGGVGSLMFLTLFLVLGFAGLVAGTVWSVRIYSRYCLAVPVCVVERLRFSDSLRRSKFLSHASLLRIFLIYLLLVILSLALSAALSIPNYIETTLNSGALINGKEPLPFQLWSIIAGFLAGTLAGPIGTIAIALVYYDQRVRKEAFDLQLMMEAIGPPLQPQATGAAAPGIG